MSEYNAQKVTHELIRQHFQNIDNMEEGRASAIMSTVLSSIETMKHNSDPQDFAIYRQTIMEVLLDPKPNPKCKYIEVWFTDTITNSPFSVLDGHSIMDHIPSFAEMSEIYLSPELGLEFINFLRRNNVTISSLSNTSEALQERLGASADDIAAAAT
jgi:hypothetical protein